jgi:4-hydroxy-2-oxoheptanedioate aldolase
MDIKKNKVKASFKEGKTTFGLWNGIANPYVAEICAGAGFDWVVIDAEHAPFDLPSILTNTQAMAAHQSDVIVRPPSDDHVLIKRLLDMGIQTFIIPMVDTEEQAHNLVKAITYPPKGIRGVAPSLSRAAQWGRVPDYVEKVEEEICLIIQIESVTGMENLEAICQIDGIDGIFIGPADLAASMGKLGQSMSEEVRAVVRKGLQVIKASGKVGGTLALRDDLVKEYREAGATFIGVGVDLMLLTQATEALAKKYKK